MICNTRNFKSTCYSVCPCLYFLIQPTFYSNQVHEIDLAPTVVKKFQTWNLYGYSLKNKLCRGTCVNSSRSTLYFDTILNLHSYSLFNFSNHSFFLRWLIMYPIFNYLPINIRKCTTRPPFNQFQKQCGRKPAVIFLL